MDYIRLMRVFCFIGLFFTYFSQLAEASGYIHVRFALYEFQHLQRPRPRINTDSQNPDQTTSTTVTSPGPHNDVKGEWQLRSRVDGQRSNISAGGTSPETSNAEFPWLHETVCNETLSTSGPRYRFLLCLDPYDALPDARPCQLARLETDDLLPDHQFASPFSSDMISFTGILGRTQSGVWSHNPVIFGFEEWPGGVRLRVYVTCCGVVSEVSGRCQETLTFTARAPPLPGSIDQAVVPRYIALTGGARLMISILAQCDPDYYGPSCSSRCRVDAQVIEHAFCNLTTGERQCLPGWESPECQVDRDECRLNYCQNGATCVNDPPGSFTCQCPFGTQGRLCEFRVPVCHTRPCHNGGTCTDTNYGHVCFCPHGYTGYRCEISLEIPNINRNTDSDPYNTTVAGLGSVGRVSGNPNVQIGGLQEWHIALIVCAVVLLISIAIISCILIRGRIRRYKFSISRAFYSIYIRTKTIDNVMYDRDGNADIICGTDDSSHYPHRQNGYMSCADRSPGLAQARRSVQNNEDLHPDSVHLHRASGQSFVCNEYNDPETLSSASSKKRRDRQDSGNSYTDLINPYCTSTLSDCDSLTRYPQSPGLRTVNAVCSPRPTLRSVGRMISPPAVGRHVTVPQMVITQRVEPLPNGDSACSTRLAHADVYAIGGSFTSDDIVSTRSKPRKSFMDAINTKPNPFEPKLRSIRRVDSGGYEVPRVAMHPRTALENEYTTLAIRYTEEHIYDEIHRYISDLDCESDTQSLRELGFCTSVPPPRKLEHKRLDFSPRKDKIKGKFSSPEEDRKKVKSSGEDSPSRIHAKGKAQKSKPDSKDKKGKVPKSKPDSKDNGEKKDNNKNKKKQKKEEPCSVNGECVTKNPPATPGSSG